MEITPQTIITLAAMIAAVVGIAKYYNKAYDLVKRQDEQDKAIKAIQEEQQLLTYGVLACLKGLHEQGCNDSVTGAINKIETYLNAKAHT